MARRRKPLPAPSVSKFHCVKPVRGGFVVMRGKGKSATPRRFNHIGESRRIGGRMATVLKRRENAAMLAYWLAR